MKKVLIITYYWPPSGGAGVQRWLKFAKYLPEYGIEPLVLTVDPCYASYPQIDKSLEKDISPNLKVFKTRSFEVLRILSGIFGKQNVPYGGFSNVDKKSLFQMLLRFIRGNFFIPDARVGWNRYALQKARGIIREYDIDTIITTGPPHSTHLVGLRLKTSLQVRWIADFRDPWTDIYYYSDMLHSSVVKRIDSKKERKVLSEADRVIAINNSVRDLLMSKTGKTDAEKFTVISNGFDEEDFESPAAVSDNFVITYTGTMSGHYSPQVFFRTLSRLIGKYPELNIKYRLVGNISFSTEREIKKHGLYDNFEYIGYVNHEMLAGILKSSTVLLYVFPETTSYKGSSGKLFEYLAARRPVIAIDSPHSDAAFIIEECEAGKCFPPEDDKGLLDYMEYLVREFKKNGELKAGNGMHLKYSRKKLTAGLSELLV